jgi:hypothetical protein
MRTLEISQAEISIKLDTVIENTSEIRSEAQAAKAVAWRNFWSVAIGIFIVVCTTVGEHIWKVVP